MNRETAKIGIAVVILAAAIVVYFRWGRSAGASADDSTTYWYCTKTNKPFQLSGKENEEKVVTGHLTPESSAEGVPVVRRNTDYVTMAKSPYTNDWTGIPAAKCEKCGEIFPLDTTGKKKNVCPKCHWDPTHAPEGPGEGASAKTGD